MEWGFVMPKETIIIFPEYDELKKDIEKLRTELSMLMLQYDDLRLVECRNIEMEYMLLLGGLEYKAYELECQYLRLKRKIELIQMSLNRQEKVVITSIELTLDEEFYEYRKKLDEQMDKMNDALERSKCKVMSDDEAKELKSLYRKAVKALHPDLHPDATDAQVALLCNATEAYENGDIIRMRIIVEMLSADELPEGKDDAMLELASEKKRLTSLIAQINEKISVIKSGYPYILKELICSKERIDFRRNQLNDVIRQYTEAIQLFSAKIEELTR